MGALKAHVRNGRIVVDEPTDLPEGSEVIVALIDAGDMLDEMEREALHRSIDEGIADVENGDVDDAFVFAGRLRVRAALTSG